MDNLLRDLRYALRRLRQDAGFSTIAVAIMALGIGANTAMFSLVHTMLFRPLAFETPDDLVRIYVTEPRRNVPIAVSHLEFHEIRDRADLFSGAVFNSDVEIWSLVTDAGAEAVMGEYLSYDYFSFLGLSPFLGRDFSPEEGEPGLSEPVALVSYGAWQRRFGGRPEIVGERVRLNGSPVTLVGVGPKQFRGTIAGFDSDFFLPWGTATLIDPEARSDAEDRTARELGMIARLRPGVSFEKAQAALGAMGRNFAVDHPEASGEHGLVALRAKDVRVHPMLDMVLSPVAAFVMIVVGLVLVVACSNLANLLLARAAGRRREVALRLAIGASRRHLIGQLLCESLLLAVVGGICGLAVAALLARLFASWQPPIPVPVTIDLELNGAILGFTLLLSLATGLLFGLAPALRATRVDLVAALKVEASAERLGGRMGRISVRNLLVAGQVAVSTLLLVGAGLFVRGALSAQGIDPGFATERAAVANLNVELGGYTDERLGRDLLERYRARLATIPGVTSVALTSRVPLGLLGSNEMALLLPGEERQSEAARRVEYSVVSGDYFAALEIPIVAGRTFTPADDEAAPRVVMVSEALSAELFGTRSGSSAMALGRQLLLASGESVEVVGVARDTKVTRLSEAPRPLFYLPFAQQYEPWVFAVARTTGSPAAVPEAMRRELEELDPRVPIFEAKTMQEHLGLMLYPTRIAAGLLAGFGFLALALASLGLYGVIAFWVKRRTREVGIRLALGADRRRLIRMVLREGLGMALVGLLAGGGLAVLAMRPLGALLYGISPADPTTFGVVALLLLVVTAAASYLPARRAAAVDPVVALRAE